MELRPALPAEARRILDLARRDPAAAREAMRALPLEAQLDLVAGSPVAHRGPLLDLAPEPERLVPRLPPAELCFTAKAVGLRDAEWLLEHATTEQITACVDLDAWGEFAPDRAELDAWLKAFAEAGEDPLLRFARGLDLELLVLALRERAEVAVKPEDADEWQPPAGGRTLDGVFYLVARTPGDDLAEILALLDVLFRNDYWVYFRLLQGAVWELESDTEEWALRWRTGRLQDLGFPTWEESMRIYGFLRRERWTEIPPEAPLLPVGEWPLPVWMPRLPTSGDAGPSLFRALGALPEEERRPHLYAFLALANRVAVADRRPLGDAETLPLSIEKAARRASRGLDLLVEHHGLAPEDVLRRVPLERLFRVGHNVARAEHGGAAEARPSAQARE